MNLFVCIANIMSYIYFTDFEKYINNILAKDYKNLEVWQFFTIGIFEMVFI